MAIDEVFRLDGARTLVTGASRGIGAAIARAFADAGADVAMTARSAEALKDTADYVERAGRRAVLIHGDLADPAEANRLVSVAAESLGGIDILVHNAGVAPVDEQGVYLFAPLEQSTDEQWEPVLSVNLHASVALCRAAHPHLAKSSRASVILVSSISGLMACPTMEAYAVTKAAQISLTKSLSISWARQGIRVNALCPGWTSTDMTRSVEGNPELSDLMLAQVPLGRWGKVDEMGAATLFLASGSSSFMTGQTLVVDGGMSTAPVMGFMP